MPKKAKEDIANILTALISTGNFTAISLDTKKEHTNFLIGLIAGMELVKTIYKSPILSWSKLPSLLVLSGAIAGTIFEYPLVGHSLFTINFAINALHALVDAYKGKTQRLYYVLNGAADVACATAVGTGLAGEIEKTPMSATAAGASLFKAGVGTFFKFIKPEPPEQAPLIPPAKGPIVQGPSILIDNTL